MLSAARYGSKAASRAIQGPKGISFSTVRSGRARSTRRANRSHARLSCDMASGNWQMAMCIASPDANTVPWREIQRLPGQDVEGLVPGVEVSHRGNAKAFRCVIGGDLFGQGVVAIPAAPGSREADEELPVLLPHVLRIAHPAAQRLAVRVERGRQSRQVGDVLDQSEPAVDRLARRK